MSFSVTILGSAWPNLTPDRHPSAQIVKVHEQHYLVDAGEGAQQQMFRYGINPLKLRAVFISHLHGDHVFGLFPLISTLGLYGRRTPLKIFGPAPLGEMLDATCATSTRNYPTKSNGWKSIRPGTPYCSKTARSRCGAFPCVTASPPSGYLFREKQPPLNVRKEKITEYGLSIARITAAKRGEDILLDNGDTLPQCGTDLPTLRATFICLSLGYELVAQSGKTRRGGRSALPRNDLRPRRAQDRPRAGSLHYGRSGPHRSLKPAPDGS